MYRAVTAATLSHLTYLPTNKKQHTYTHTFVASILACLVPSVLLFTTDALLLPTNGSYDIHDNNPRTYPKMPEDTVPNSDSVETVCGSAFASP